MRGKLPRFAERAARRSEYETLKAAWSHHADLLAEWCLARLFNRTDVWGAYSGKGPIFPYFEVKSSFPEADPVADSQFKLMFNLTGA